MKQEKSFVLLFHLKKKKCSSLPPHLNVLISSAGLRTRERRRVMWSALDRAVRATLASPLKIRIH